MYEPGPSDEQQARSNRPRRDFRRYLLDVVAHRARTRARTSWRRSSTPRSTASRLTDDQVVSTAMVLLMAGHEATVNATSNGVAALAANPDQWQLLRSGASHRPRGDRGDPALRPAAPVVRALGARGRRGALRARRSSAGRASPSCWARRTVTRGAFPNPSGSTSPAQTRAHIAFGGGIHFCIGAPLARMELEATLNELVATEDELVVLPGAERRPTFQFRGYERLEVALHPA